LLQSAWLHVVILLAIVGFCFARTIATYFLADDFGHIGYLATACHGHWNMLWANFTGNFMQIPGMKVYRPWQMINEACDWLLYRADARGYYATNIAYFFGCVILLYLIGRNIFREWGPARASSTALFAAILFAANPLRCESVSWMVGRVDIVAGFFYLLAGFIYLTQTSLRWRLAGTFSFLLALLTKEMPVGLPILLLATFTLLPTDFVLEQPVLKRFTSALTAGFKRTALLWATLVGYFVVRTTCLGTVTGGYTGGFGVAGNNSLICKWLDPDTIHRLFFPFNAAVISEPNVYSKMLACCYGALGILFIVRLFSGSVPWRHFVVLAVWLATAAAPIYQLWGLGYNLEGSRFYYFLSMPLMLILSALVFAPYSFGFNKGTLERRFTVFGAFALAIASLVMVRITATTNAAWVNAGKEVRRCADACVELAQKQPSGQFVVLGIPKERAGAHQILNGTTFNTMLDPPFRATHYSPHFISYAPVMFGREDLIDALRFRACVEKNVPIYVWKDGKELRRLNVSTVERRAPAWLLPATLSMHSETPSLSAQSIGHADMQSQNDAIVLTNVQSDDGLALSGLQITPWQYDFLEFDVTVENGGALPDMRVVWAAPDVAVNKETAATNYMPATLQEVGSTKTEKRYKVSVQLSHSWHWFAQPAVGKLLILPGGALKVAFKNIRLVASAQVAPTISVAETEMNNAGIIEKNANELTLLLTGPAPGAAQYQVQIGKPNFFLDNFDQANLSSAIGEELTVGAAGPADAALERRAPQAELKLSGAAFNKAFPVSGYYQVRARCLSATHQPVGEFSDLITISISRPTHRSGALQAPSGKVQGNTN
jgi:hypothetical protein